MTSKARRTALLFVFFVVIIAGQPLVPSYGAS